MSNDNQIKAAPQVDLPEESLDKTLEDSSKENSDDHLEDSSKDISEETLEEISQQKGQFDALLKELELEALPSIDICETVGGALKFMQENKKSSIVILDGDTLAGIITEKDFIEHLGIDLNESLEKPISEFMTPNPMTLSLNSTVREAIEVLTKRNFRHIPLVDENNRPTNLLSITEILYYIAKVFKVEFIIK